MKKEAKKTEHSYDNSFGVAAVVLGILSIVFASFYGLILSIIALVFANKQNARQKNSWSKAGKILAIIGIILSVITIIATVFYFQDIIAQTGTPYAIQ